MRLQDMLSPTARAAAVHSTAAGASSHGGSGLTATQSLPPMQRGDQVQRPALESEAGCTRAARCCAFQTLCALLTTRNVLSCTCLSNAFKTSGNCAGAASMYQGARAALLCTSSHPAYVPARRTASAHSGSPASPASRGRRLGPPRRPRRSPPRRRRVRLVSAQRAPVWRPELAPRFGAETTCSVHKWDGVSGC